MDTSLLSQPHRPGVGHAADAASGLDQPDLHEQFPEFRRRRFLFAAGHFDYFSGAERQAVYFAGELVKQLQADVRFIGWGGNGRFADEIRAVGAEPVVYPLDPSLRTWRTRFELISLANYIRRELRPDFLLPYVWMHCRILGAIWPWTGARFCWWNQRDEGRGITGSLLEQYLIRSLPAIVSNSLEGRDFLLKRFNLRSDRITLVNNGVRLPPAGRSNEWRSTWGIPSATFMMAMVGTLSRYKDHETLLRAISLLLQTHNQSQIRLILAGADGDTADHVRWLVNELSLRSVVHLVGNISDVDSLLRSTDLLIHSSRTEGCPNAALEAMAVGTPVVGTDIPGMRQAIGNERASELLAPPGDHARLAEKMKKLMLDASLRESEGSANRSRIAKAFSISRMAYDSLNVIRNNLQ